MGPDPSTWRSPRGRMYARRRQKGPCSLSRASFRARNSSEKPGSPGPCAVVTGRGRHAGRRSLGSERMGGLSPSRRGHHGDRDPLRLPKRGQGARAEPSGAEGSEPGSSGVPNSWDSLGSSSKKSSDLKKGPGSYWGT